MAGVLVSVRRQCPSSAFEAIENAVADVVGPIVYEEEYPEDADVDVTVAHGKLGTFMVLRPEIDTEDVPGKGWVITESGLCVRAASKLAFGKIEELEAEVTPAQWNTHSLAQGTEIRDRFLEHPIWGDPNIGWEGSGIDPERQLGVYVVRAEGAWVATYTQPTDL